MEDIFHKFRRIFLATSIVKKRKIVKEGKFTNKKHCMNENNIKYIVQFIK